MTDILLTNNELCDKLEAHKQGLQHFAFSVFLFNNDGKMLIQKRAENKYHSGGLWSNSCCSHFRNLQEFQNKEQTAINRVNEEIGVLVEKLEFIDIFSYKTPVGNGLIENEVDYLYVGMIDNDTDFQLNKDEVEKIDFVGLDYLANDIRASADKYTEWFKSIILSKNWRKITTCVDLEKINSDYT